MLDLRELAELGDEQLRELVATVDAEELVGAVTATDDATLTELARDARVRAAAVTGVLSRLDEFAVPEQLAVVRGTAGFELATEDGVERHAVEFRDGEIRPHLDIDAAVPVDVRLRTGVLGFLRIVSGEHNAALEYLSGRLDIQGDAALALAVGGLFRVPGTDRVACDPTDLDPEAVSAALTGVSDDHLARVMDSGFRPVVLAEIFRRLPDFVAPRAARKAELVIGFRLTRADEGEPERYVVALANGRAVVTAGDDGAERDATITCTGGDFLRLATGHLNPVTGVMKGRLKVRGDRAKALQLSALLDIPGSG